MSDVFLRCPHCGTTQAAPGECEACHEDTVRYFCPNHTPGQWLDGPVCPECSARVASGRAAAPQPRRGASRKIPRDIPRETPRNIPREIPREVPPEIPRGAPPTAPRRRTAWTDTPREAPPVAPRPATPPRVPRWPGAGLPTGMRPEDMLSGMLRTRGLSFAVGCLKRLFVFGVIAAILFAIATIWFFSGVIDLGANEGRAPTHALVAPDLTTRSPGP